MPTHWKGFMCLSDEISRIPWSLPGRIQQRVVYSCDGTFICTYLSSERFQWPRESWPIQCLTICYTYVPTLALWNGKSENTAKAQFDRLLKWNVPITLCPKNVVNEVSQATVCSNIIHHIYAITPTAFKFLVLWLVSHFPEGLVQWIQIRWQDIMGGVIMKFPWHPLLGYLYHLEESRRLIEYTDHHN